MPVTGRVMGKYLLRQFDGSTPVDWQADTIKCALITSAWTPNYDTDQYFSTPQASEASGTGYTAGGATIGTKAVTHDTANDRIELDCADITWPGSTVTARYAVFYKDTANPATSPIIGVIAFGADRSSSASTFRITNDAEGVVQIGY